ncbi:hypothetical protein VW23_026260 [Devosia insulae DS-56]|uniref:Uncharacterized protein n=1 Tax=Devosia insulae DS-56 TaxID=1116389 RepID=A0A1E5XL25_9HYPH|nr:hypothetical protein [Devosia insulae]OEO29275.1 hypothetical protein VW23_026260 [Devosia insulae DS-56]
MALLRSGLVLFVSVTLMAALTLGALLVSTGNIGGWRLDTSSDWSFLFQLSIVTLPTSILLVVLAWRGRRQPLTDGVALMTCIAILACLVVYFWWSLYPPHSGHGYAILVWIYAGIGLAALVPAYLISYLALCRTPLLRGLAPPAKAKGAA